MFAAWSGASAAFGLLSLVALGAGGVGAYLADLALASHWTLTQRFTLGELAGHGPLLAGLQALLVALTLVTARRQRDAGPELVVAVGISGSLLVTPYIGYQDFLMLALAAWLVLRAAPSTLVVAVIAAAYIVLELGLVLGTLPVLLAELALLGVICAHPPAKAPFAVPKDAYLAAKAPVELPAR
jgi:hypothetical protein